MLTAIKILLSVIRKSIMPMILVALLVSNGLMLFYSSFHDVLYSALETFVPATWTKNSPTSKYRAKKAQYDSKLLRVTEKTGRITKRVTARAIKGATANAAGAFAEAIPFVGVVTIVGLTAMDVSDACNDIKDMHELEKMLSIESNPADVNRVCGLKTPTADEVTTHVKSKYRDWWGALFQTMGL